MSFRRKCAPCVCLLVLLSLLTLLSAVVHAQESGTQTFSANGHQFVRLEHTRAAVPHGATAKGRVESGRPLHRMLLVLSANANREQELKSFLEDQQNPNSPNYHHWLTAAEFGRRFGAADADLQKMCEWLDQSGLNVTGIAASKRWIEFSGTAAQVESAFQTDLQYFQWRGKNYLGNSTDLAVPAELSGITRGLVSLNSFAKQPPIRESRGSAGLDKQGHKTLLSPNLTASGGGTNTYYLAPGDFAAIYNTNGLLSSGNDGTGISIAVTAQSQIELTDVQTFRQIFGLKTNDPNIIVSGPDPGIVNIRDTQEAQLDVEWAGAIAPGATINLIVAGSTDTTSGVDLAAAYAIDNEVAPILTYTYGSCEQALGPTGNAFYNSLWKQAAAEGITVLVAAGDNGAAGCDDPNAWQPAIQGMAVNGVASTPYNLAVGGTEFVEGSQPSTYWSSSNTSNYTSALGYIPEAAWNGSCDPAQATTDTNCAFGNTNFSLLAGGGGASSVYSKPAWQVGSGVPADNARDVPDVALAASSRHDEYVYCTSVTGVPCQVNDQHQVFGLTLVGGTSVPTPAMAGILALIEQKNGAFQGLVNYSLYRLAQTAANVCNSSDQLNPTAQNSCVFYDVTSGNNAVPCAGGSPNCSSTQGGVNGFLTGNAAGTGYDLATGLGSVNATNLANAWKNISLAKSQTVLDASSTSFTHGTAVTLSGTVSPASGNGTPTGMVSIKTDQHGDSKQVLALTNGGTFSGSVSDLPGGQYNLYAHYAGDAIYAASNSIVVPVIITPEDSVTSLAALGVQNTSVPYGVPVQLKVTIAGASGQGIATGVIVLKDGSNVVGTYTVGADGTACITTGNGLDFVPGMHTLTADYSGDNSFNASTSSAVQLTITKGTPFVVVGVNASSVPVGGTLGAHAVVSGFGAIPATGTVQFTVDGATYGAPLALQTGGFFGTQAQAAILITGLTPGTRIIGASYNGSADPNYKSVASGDPQNELTQTVTVGTSTGTKTTTVLTVQPMPMNLGDPGTFSVAVSPASATGTVTVWDAVGPRSAATTITSGTATIQFGWTQAGTASVYAVYSGDSTFASSSSPPTVFTVNKGLPQVTLTAPASASSTQQVTLNVSVSGNPANKALPYPTGTIEIWDSLNGGTAQLLTTQILTAGTGGLAVYATRTKMSPGTHSLYAHYRGDTNWQAANSQPVPLASATYSLTVTNPLIVTAGSTGSGTVTVTPSGGFTGAVSLTCGTGGTMVPAGYTCSFAPASVSVSGTAAATSQINFTVTSTSASAVKIASATRSSGMTDERRTLGFLVAFLLLGLTGMFASGTRDSRNFFLACGLVLALASAVVGCGGGGGGGGGGGPVPTSTTIVSSNLHVGVGTPVTFTVTVTPQGSATPSGQVQLYDNGQPFGAPTSVSAGIASFLATNLPVGIHNIMARYNGDANTLASTSGTIAQGITGTIGLQITGSSNGLSQTADFQVVVN